MKALLSQLLCVSIFVLGACQTKNTPDGLFGTLSDTESITGNPEYLNTPFVTAGDRLYMVGHQDGSFPDLGWHVTGEMGGIWDHPIKLMDGFSLNIQETGNEESTCLDEAREFVNYPFANKHIFETGDLRIERLQFVPDGVEGLVVEYAITNNGSKEKNLRLSFTGMVDLMPVWLAERKNIVDDKDTLYLQELSETFLGKDKSNDWFTVFGSSEAAIAYLIDDSPCKQERKGLGTDGTIVSSVAVAPGETYPVQYYIAGSYTSSEEAQRTYDELRSNASSLLADKKQRYEQLAQTAAINIPDKDIETMYRWVKYNTDWLVRDVPETGRGISAGLPDYPWWFGADNCYTLQGLLTTGSHGEVLSTIDLIQKLSMELNGNGQIIHETSTNGETYNPGNLNETPHFIYLLWEAYKWTGDEEMLDQYYPEVKKGISWIESQDKDSNGYPDGPGMMEIHGLHSEMVDVAVYTQQAYVAAASMAEEMGDSQQAISWQSKAESLRQKINAEWWVDEFNSFADFRSTKKEALALIDAAMVRADTINKPLAIGELQATRQQVQQRQQSGTNGYVVHHNWVVNTPMEMGIADPEKAAKALTTGRKYSNRFGIYVTGMDRDESSDASSKWKAFSYVGAVMTLPTGVQAISEARYGNPDEALGYLKNLHNSFGYALPGSMYEVSPDYGMIVQAWNIYAVAVPIVSHFFGIKAEAHKKRITIQPDMPQGWDNVAISNVVVGDNVVGYEKATINGQVTYKVLQSNEGWEVMLVFPSTDIDRVTVDGKEVVVNTVDGKVSLTLTGPESSVVLLND